MKITGREMRSISRPVIFCYTTPMNTKIEITPKTLFWIVGIVAGAAVAFYLRHFILVVLVSLVVASFVEPAVLNLKKIKIPRYVSVPFLFLIGLGVLAGTVALLVPVFSNEFNELINLLPKGSDLARGFTSLNRSGFTETTLQRFTGSDNPFVGIQSIWQSISGSGVVNIAQGLLDVSIILVLSFYFAITEKGFDEFLRVITPKQFEDNVVKTWQRVEKKIGDWFMGQVFAAFIVGLLTYGILSIMQVPYALILAIVAAVFDLIPFGTLLGTIPAALIGFISGGWAMMFWVIIGFIIIHYIEIYLIQPLVIRRTVGIPIIVMIISVIAWGLLGGILGVLVSIPCAIVIMDLIGDK